ncbi:MAG: urease accessory UreF family protein, partial [Pseudomonadota bacterium]
DQGAAFIQTTNAILNSDAPNLVLPVAVGFVARQLSLETRTVAALYLNAFATALVLAGVRFIPLGQTEGQAVLQDLHPLIAEVAAFAVDADVADIETSTFGADLSAMGHETQEVRIFRT